MNLRRGVIAVALGVALAGTALGGAWPRKAQSGYLQLGFSTIGYDNVYDASGTKVPAAGKVRDNVLQLYAEYGLSDALTLGLIVPFGVLSVNDYAVVYPPWSSVLAPPPADVSTSGIGDIAASAQVAILHQGGSVLSAGMLFGFPTGDTTSTEGLWLGDGEFNVAPRILYGLSLYPIPMYISADLGYNFRGAGYSNEVFGSLEAGYGVLPNRLYVIVQLSVQKSTQTEPSRDIPAARLGLYNNNREFVAITPKLLYTFGNGVGAIVSYATAASGRNVAGGAVLAGSVFYEF
jgi:hypothetical protein